ncbi:MAG: tRNA (adenosine(37)-N6)-threonylcarbamoyltransferase complex ATPase subunit type 1 TsaE [Bacteroidetes bacterium]|nr:tRNA (adenosine(37)-N6)-threonylcarbamoyltransferase complex ATPase subunit type 1 TsaE [Bacteroidota bacterium]
MVKEVTLKNIDAFAQELAGLFLHKIVLLEGDLGAGKTTLVKAIFNALGATDAVSSPTFGIANEVQLASEKAYHLDLYRIENSDELPQFGFEEYLYTGGFCFIEWPEIAMAYIPESHHTIRIETIDANTRKIIFT